MNVNDHKSPDNILISLVFPVYNVEKYLDRCMKSVLNQSYTNIEIILVDDGATDDSGNLCDQFAKEDARVRVIHQKNKGLPGARNSGLKVAQGVYVGFIDPDDEIEIDMVRDFVQVAQQHQPDIICSNITQYAKGNVKSSTLRNNLPYGKMLGPSEIKTHLLQPYYGGYLGIIPSACTKMYNVAFLNKNNLLFDESLKRAEDYWFNLFAFKKAQSVYAIDKSYYHYYSNAGSVIRSLREDQFEMFVKSRSKLLQENETINSPVNWNKLNTDFFNNVSEFILLYIRNKNISTSYKKVTGIIKHPEFQRTINDNSANALHTKLIKKSIKLKAYPFAFLVYWYWSKKL